MQQLKAWYNWECSPRSRQLKKKVGDKVLNKVYNRNRKKRVYSKFASLFPEKVSGPLSVAYQAEGVHGRKCLPVWTQVMKDLWQGASAEERDKVNKALEDDVRAEEQPASPEEIQKYESLYVVHDFTYLMNTSRAIDAIPAILTAALAPLSDRTSMAFFVSYIGQHPGDDDRVKFLS